MKDQIRDGWLKKIHVLEESTEKVVDASKERSHKPFVMNKTMRPIVITGLGPDINDNGIKIKGVLTLGVLGEDDRCTAIQEITKYTDEELDNCSSYMSFIRSGLIQEVDQEEAKYRIQQALDHRNNLQQNAMLRQQLLMQRQMPPPAFMNPQYQQYYQQVQQSPIEEIHLGRNTPSFANPDDNYSIPGMDMRYNDYDSMSQFYGDIYKR